MDFDSTMAWCKDLSIDIESDIVVFAIAELTKAPTMGYFNRKEWVEGWKGVKKDSTAAQKEHVSSLRSQMKGNEAYFKKVYSFCFDYAKEEGQKSLGQ